MVNKDEYYLWPLCRSGCVSRQLQVQIQIHNYKICKAPLHEIGQERWNVNCQCQRSNASIKGIALTGRSCTGPPCSVGRPPVHAPGSRPARTPAALQTTDDDDRRQTSACKQYWPIRRASKKFSFKLSLRLKTTVLVIEWRCDDRLFQDLEHPAKK